jgi:hypothetical protein
VPATLKSGSLLSADALLIRRSHNGQAEQMDKPSNQSDLRCANWAFVFLGSGLLVFIVALAMFFLNVLLDVQSAWLGIGGLIGILLFFGLEGAALVLGIMGRRHARGQNVVAGAIFLILLALLTLVVSFEILYKFDPW